MNLTEILETIDSYARDYIRYILAVVNRDAFKTEARDFDPKLVIFSLFSVIIGSYLFDRFARHMIVTQSTILETATRVFAVWLAVGVVFYFGLNRLSRTRADFSATLSIVLRVLPVAYVLSAFAASVAAEAVRLFRNDDCYGWWGYLTLWLGEVLVVFFLMPPSVARYFEQERAVETPPDAVAGHARGAHPGRGRIMLLSLGVIFILLFSRLFTIAVFLADTAKQSSADAVKQCKMDRRCADAARIRQIRLYMQGIGECFQV